MANPLHLAVVKKGRKAIDKWRLDNPKDDLELSHADLAMAQLSDANLNAADLSGANLKKADLYGADLSYVDLSRAKLAGAKLGFCDLSGAELSKADFSNCDLSYADIRLAYLSNANLSGTLLIGTTFIATEVEKPEHTNLKDATLEYTNFIGCDMKDFENINTIKHSGPSSFDIDTMIYSYSTADEFERKLEPFFLNAGVPKSFLDLLPDIVTGITYCKCFVCYGEPDKAFAEKLVKDLKAKEIGCWIYSMDATPGEKVWKEIAQKRREADKMIVLCSVKSLIRDGVKKEIEEQMDEESEKMIPISLDNSWKEEGFEVKRGKRDLKHDLIDCTYADFSDPANYDASFRKLLKGLKKN